MKWDSTLKTNEAAEKISHWFRENEKNIEYLLPQKLPEDVFRLILACAQNLIDFAKSEKDAPTEGKEKTSTEALELIIGMFLADENGLFKARRSDVEQGVKAYAMNLVLEGLRRKEMVTFKEFTLDDVLTLNFEREIKTTPALREVQNALKKQKIKH